MNKIKLVLLSALPSVILVLVFISIQVARGIWIDPPNLPPASNVGAPLTTGAAYQEKTAGNGQNTGLNGKIKIEDISTFQAPEWQKDVMRTKFLSIGQQIIAPITSTGSAAAGASWHPVNVGSLINGISTINGIPIAPLNAHVKELIVRFICSETIALVSASSGATPSLVTEGGGWVTYNDSRTVCNANSNRDGVSEVSVPVTELGNGTYQFFYWPYPTEPGSMHLSAYIIGTHYTY